MEKNGEKNDSTRRPSHLSSQTFNPLRDSSSMKTSKSLKDSIGSTLSKSRTENIPTSLCVLYTQVIFGLISSLISVMAKIIVIAINNDHPRERRLTYH